MVQAQRRRKSNASHSYPSAPSLRNVGGAGLLERYEAKSTQSQKPGLGYHQRNETKYFSAASLSIGEQRQCENASPDRFPPFSSDSIPTSQPSLAESLVSSRSSSCATLLGKSSLPSQAVNDPRKSFKKQSSMPTVLPSSASCSSDSSWGLFVDVEEKHADIERRLSASVSNKIRS
jgi:hypothetical protein